MITLKVRKPKNDLERNLKISMIFSLSFCLVLLDGGDDGDMGAKSE